MHQKIEEMNKDLIAQCMRGQSRRAEIDGDAQRRIRALRQRIARPIGSRARRENGFGPGLRQIEEVQPGVG